MAKIFRHTDAQRATSCTFCGGPRVAIFDENVCDVVPGVLIPLDNAGPGCTCPGCREAMSARMRKCHICGHKMGPWWPWDDDDVAEGAQCVPNAFLLEEHEGCEHCRQHYEYGGLLID